MDRYRLTKPSLPKWEIPTRLTDLKATGNYVLNIVFVVAAIYRAFALFQVPQVTTDAFRNLGYASHAFENDMNIYNTIGMDFEGEVWARFNVWNGVPYQYPPVTLMFFYLFSVLGLGIFWVKLVLTGVDTACAYLLNKRVSKTAAALYFAAPVSMWFTSHEGQFETLQTFTIMLTAIAISNRRWRQAGFLFALSIQVKLWGILIIPWMLFEFWQTSKTRSSLAILRDIAVGISFGVLPFIRFYLKTPSLLFISVQVTSRQTVNYNPFAWEFWNFDHFGWNPAWLIYWNALFTLIPLALLIGLLIKDQKWENLAALTPLGSFWTLTKSLSWGQFWYTIVGPGFLLTFEKRTNLIILLLMLYFFQGARSTALISGFQFGHQENPQIRALMQECMYKCDLQAIFDQNTIRQESEEDNHISIFFDQSLLGKVNNHNNDQGKTKTGVIVDNIKFDLSTSALPNHPFRIYTLPTPAITL